MRPHVFGSLPMARQAVRGVLSGQRVLVLGSAAGTMLPERADVQRVFCANGAAGIARDAGLRVDLWCLAGQIALHDVAEQPDVPFIRGVSVRSVLCIGSQTLEAMTRWLRVIGVSYQVLHGLLAPHRQAIVNAICGPLGPVPRHERVSTGVFAVCLALWGGAARIVVAGISLKTGYAYRPDPLTVRTHQIGDLRCLPILRDRYKDRVVTLTPELLEFGFAHV